MSGFANFERFLKSYGKLLAWILGAGVCLPVAAARAGLLPPWPDGIVFATALLEIVGLATVYQFARDAPRGQLKHICFTCAASLMLVCIVYFCANSLLVFDVGDGSKKMMRGLICRSEARIVFGDDCPLLTLAQIKQSENNPQVLWTMSSIMASRIILLVLWCTSFSLLAAFLGTFIWLQRRPGR